MLNVLPELVNLLHLTEMITSIRKRILRATFLISKGLSFGLFLLDP